MGVYVNKVLKCCNAILCIFGVLALCFAICLCIPSVRTYVADKLAIYATQDAHKDDTAGALEEQLQNMQSIIDDYVRKNAEQQSEIDALRAQVAQLLLDNENNASDYDLLCAQKSALEEQLSIANETITKLHTDLAEYTDIINQLRDQITIIKQQLDDKTRDYDSAIEQISIIQSMLDIANATIASLNEQIDDYKLQIDALETRIIELGGEKVAVSWDTSVDGYGYIIASNNGKTVQSGDELIVGTSLKLIAVPYDDYRFIKWTCLDKDYATELQIEIPITLATTNSKYIAYFGPKPYITTTLNSTTLELGKIGVQIDATFIEKLIITSDCSEWYVDITYSYKDSVRTQDANGVYHYTYGDEVIITTKTISLNTIATVIDSIDTDITTNKLYKAHIVLRPMATAKYNSISGGLAVCYWTVDDLPISILFTNKLEVM